MAAEKRNPLPANIYYTTVFAPDWPKFDAWLAKYAADVKVRKVKFLPKIDECLWFSCTETQHPGQWILFEVMRSDVVTWEMSWWPDIAPKGLATEEEDTYTAPPPEEPFDWWDDDGGFFGGSGTSGGPSIGTWLLVGGALTLGGILLVKKL